MDTSLQDTSLTTTSTDAYVEMWAAGEISDAEALRVLCEDLRALDDALATLAAQRDTLRGQIGRIVTHLGGGTTLAGVGRLEITAPAVTVSYERRQIEALIIALTAEAPEIAARIAACRKESARSGGLRITPLAHMR